MRARARRVAAGLVAAGAMGCALLSTGAPAAADSGSIRPAGEAAPTLPADLTLVSIRPVAPQPGDTLIVRGTVTDTGATPLQSLTLALWADPNRVTSRGQFDEFADTSTATIFSGGLVPEPAAHLTVAHSTLAPGHSERWTLSLPLADLALPDAWGVYPLGVAASVDGQTEGRLRTFLPYAPTDAPGNAAVRVSWLWPLVDTPHRTVIADNDVFVDDQLAQELGAGGRLQRLLQAATHARAQHRPPRAHRHRHGHRGAAPTQPPAPPRLPDRSVPVTYAIDPMLVEDAQRMSSGYTVHAGTGSPQNGTGKSAATAWLGQLTSASRDDATLVLPYADPDVAAAVRAGEQEQVQAAFLEGQTVAGRVLAPGSELTNWYWPPDGAVNEASLNTLFDSQISTVVLDGASLPPTTEPGVQPNAHVLVPARDGDLAGVLTDSTLSTVVTDGAAADSGAALQRYLAETLLIQNEMPGTARSIVIAPQRRWDPTAVYARHLLDDTGRVPWLRPSTLQAAARAKVDTSLPRELTYGRRAQRRELPAAYLSAVAATAGQVDQLAAILGNGTPLVRDADESVLQALSSAWRGDITDADAYESALTSSIGHTVNEVHIASGGGSLVTLTSHSGTVPVTVANGLAEPVNVIVDLDAHGRGSVVGNGKVHHIPPHTQLAVDFHFTAKTSGQFPVEVRLMTPGPDSRPYGKSPVQLFLRSTAYGTVALVITIVALAVLLVAVATRLARRALRARRVQPAAS